MNHDQLTGKGFVKQADGSYAKQKRGNPDAAMAAWTELGDNKPKSSTRVRQSHAPKMNRLESEWFEIIKLEYPNFPRPRNHAKRYQLCNGVTYTPDFTASAWPSIEPGPERETAWEVKGKMAWDDAIVKIKVAAHEWPEVQWILVWKEDGEWKQQIIKP